VFYDIFKLELPRGSFGGDKWLEYYYTLDTFDWQTLARQVASLPNCPPACPGSIIRGTPTAENPIGGVDFRHVSVPPGDIDPDLKPMKMQEATAGLEHQLNDRIALSVRYVHKQLDRAVEDAGASNSPSRSAWLTTGSFVPAISGAAFLATTRACRSRTRTAARVRTSDACSITPS
jgi:hypothetical protein